jgi:hypothetical protein
MSNLDAMLPQYLRREIGLQLVLAPLAFSLEVRQIFQEREEIHTLYARFRSVLVLTNVDDELLTAYLLSGDLVGQFDHGTPILNRTADETWVPMIWFRPLELSVSATIWDCCD